MTSHEPYALVIVDTQYDFLPGGPLGAPNGQAILHPIARYAQQASLVVASRDWHPENHFSFSDNPTYTDGSWPPHCIQGTRGAKIHPSVRKYANFVISKGTKANPPDTYSAFDGKTLRPVATLAEILQRSPVSKLVVVGCVLEYCVAATAFDAASLKYNTVVPLDAVASLGDPTEIIERLKRAGVDVVDRMVV